MNRSHLLKHPDFQNLFKSKLMQHGMMELSVSKNIIRGSITLRNGFKTPIQIDTTPDFFSHITPRIYCSALWITRDEDWHTYRERNEICWVFPTEWMFYSNKWINENTPTDIIANDMADWLYRNVEYLLNIHHVAFVRGIQHWHAEWGGYAHGNQAAKKQLLPNVKVTDLKYLS